MTSDTHKIKESVVIERPLSEVFNYWRQLENLPLSMEHLKEVEKVGNDVYHWKTKAPLGGLVEWDARITDEKKNKYIRWQSINESTVENSGTVRFVECRSHDSDFRSTYLEVEINYKPPFGKIGDIIAFIFGESPKQQVKDDLQKFKYVLEKNNLININL